MQSGTKEHELLKGGGFRHRLVQNFFQRICGKPIFNLNE